MKILFLHLSDLHLNTIKSINLFQIKKITDTLNIHGRFDRMILIISGDITRSGAANQFEVAYKLVGSIIKNTKENSGYYRHIDILCVPGNHDVNHNGKSISSMELQDIRNRNLYEQNISNEIEKQDSFYNFACRNKCFSGKNVFSRKIININGFTIEANLINSALFSIIEEDKGLHYIPQYCINSLSTPSGADFVITIMHHSHDWYIDSQKNLLDTIIYGKSSLVFYGHEHYIATKAISHERDAAAIVQAGGCLCENDDWTKSTYYTGILDTDTRVYSQYRFLWNINEKQYEVNEKKSHNLTSKPSIEKRIKVQPNYLGNMTNDIKQDITKDFRDYFVFPRVQAEDQNGAIGKEYKDEYSLIEEILSRKKVLITGGYNSGKSALLKSLFISLSENYIVIFCDINDIRGKKAERIIKNCFEDIYGSNPSDYDRFIQTPKEKRILIIDDIDQISSSDFEHFLTQLNDFFECFIFASKQIFDINLLDRMKSLLKTTDLIYKFRLTPFYADKRYDLIKRVIETQSDNPDYIEKTAKILADTIKSQKRFISLDPDFIIKYVKYYCKNISEATNNDSGVFSKVFEASLINAISKHQTGKLNVDKIFVLLSKIAHYIHFNKAYPIPQTRIIEIIEYYNEEYGTNVNRIDAVNIMTKSNIIVPTENGDGYRFANNNYLAFFVAKEVNSQYNSTGDDSDIKKILQFACFGINSDILLFISYITDNIRILRLFLQMTNECTGDWLEFNFEENMPQFLNNKKKHIVELPPQDARRIEDETEIASEKERSEELKTLEIYDYSEADIDKFINQIIRACSLLVVISKCLPNFEHNMPKPDKDAFVDIVYRLPNKIFKTWAKLVDEETDAIIQYFKEQSQDYYIRQKTVTDEDILHALQWAAMSLLLDLYSLAVFHSTKNNTSQYLDNFDFSENDTYSLEHLMMLEKQNACTKFVDTAIDMVDEKKGHIYSTLLTRIVKHALVFMEYNDYKLTQRLQTKFFPSKAQQNQLTISRIKQSNIANE